MSLRRKLSWVAILYFAQGFPFGIAIDNLPVYFRMHGVSLTDIGLMSLLGYPWTLKVLWAPLVDRFGSARRWIGVALVLMAAILYLLPFFPAGEVGPGLWLILLLFTIASATQDIAIDGYTIRFLERGEEGTANGIRVAAARAAIIVAGGALVMVSGMISWTGIYHAAAGILLVLAVVISRWLPDAAPVPTTTEWWEPLWHWLRRPQAGILFAFVLTFKLGDSSMGPMVKPFWVDRGFSAEEIGFVSTTLGVVLGVTGALIGGWGTSRWGLYRGLAVFGVLQAVSNLGYAAAAYVDAGRPGVYAASLCESLTGGMGTAAFLAFLMSSCDKERAATEYALLSAIFAFSRQSAGALSGWAASGMGYSAYFALTFFFSFPALALLPWLPYRSGRPATGGAVG